jgi:dTDP-4-dehydrorhamnose reductase
VEHPEPDPLRARFPRTLVTGAGGQLGTALSEAFPWASALPRERLDIRNPLDELVGAQDLVLHSAAWTKVDDAETDEGSARAVNVLGTRRVVELGAPLVYYSTDYVFSGAKHEPYRESDTPDPRSAYGRTKLDGEREIRDGWIVRSSWLFGWTGTNFVRTMLALGRERDEVRVVDDQRGSPTYVGHLAAATRELVALPYGTYHVAADGDCTWAELAEAIFSEAGLDCRVVPISTAELGRPAPRPAYSVLRSEHAGTPLLPHWREGLRACLERLGG